MSRSLCFLSLLIFTLYSHAQPEVKHGKYPSLLWEITGKGSKKPSYLMGTMHVSSKVAFNLSDSFYAAIRSADVVALETNPETWQDDLSRYQFFGRSGFEALPNDYFREFTLRFDKYERRIQLALASNPSTINNLLYRSFGNETSDFEEDTYLDMYIFQVGKKMKKRVIGVENYDESMKLIMEAQKDALKDKNKKERSFDFAGDYSVEKIQDAYRTGNLDLLDSINRYNSISEAFDEKFIYRRNEIQAESIDSVMRSGSSLFAGVGAAHLPGQRGVIEILREKGYKLRPVRMGERAARNKEAVDRIRVPVKFRTEFSADGFFRVDIPGKFYKYGDEDIREQLQFSDMANGSYYMVTRVATNAGILGQVTADVFRIVDSLLYENIPGKIISKSTITKNGYQGFDIINRTRRGDIQRYQVFITPFEVLVFKMSGNGSYVTVADEAKRFFSSIQLKEYKANGEFKPYSPASGGFSISFPHIPHITTGEQVSWEARNENAYYKLTRTDIHNYQFAGNDSLDLALMEESFSSSGIIDTLVARNYLLQNHYPALDARFRDKNGKIIHSRFIIQGPHYYALVARDENEQRLQRFLNSFEIKPFQYPAAQFFKDSLLYFTVQSPVIPEVKKKKIEIPALDFYGGFEQDEKPEHEKLKSGAYRVKVFSSDSTGEKIGITFYHASRYYFNSDTSLWLREKYLQTLRDSGWIVKNESIKQFANGGRTWETKLTEPGSSRLLQLKIFNVNNIVHVLVSLADTLTPNSSFFDKFYTSFRPDSLQGPDPLIKKTSVFFADYFSNDSVIHQRAIDHIANIKMDSADLEGLKRVITHLNWNEKKYLAVKKSLLQKLGDINTKASADYLRDLYYELGDTMELKYTALENLLQHKNKYAFEIFSDIIGNEIPIPDPSWSSGAGSHTGFQGYPGIDNGNFLDELADSLKLTRGILDNVLPLLNLDDYERHIMELLAIMVDSNLVTVKDYSLYFPKLKLEGRHELHKQQIAEKRISIEQAEDRKSGENTRPVSPEFEAGNNLLSIYARLLIPFIDLDKQVKSMINQLLQSSDDDLKYSVFIAMLQKNKPVPDTLLEYFAMLDAFRYELYMDMELAGRLNEFPQGYLSHELLGISALKSLRSYNPPDSLEFMQKQAVYYKGKSGFVYFYQYKDKKDDPVWKIAYVGLVPPGRTDFSFGESYDFTGFTEIKFNNDIPLERQLQKVIKRILYSSHKSAGYFYEAGEMDPYEDYPD